MLRIAFAEGDPQPFGGCPLPRPLEQRRDEVDARHVAEASRRGERCIAAPRRHVEDLLARTDVDRLAEHLPHDEVGGADHREVARRPRLPLPALDRLEIAHRRPPRRRGAPRRPLAALDRFTVLGFADPLRPAGARLFRERSTAPPLRLAFPSGPTVTPYSAAPSGVT